jgi:hypothetical protein
LHNCPKLAPARSRAGTPPANPERAPGPRAAFAAVGELLLLLLLLWSAAEAMSDGIAVEMSSPETGELGESGCWARYCFFRLSGLDSISLLSHCSATAADPLLKMLRRSIADDLLHVCQQAAEDADGTSLTVVPSTDRAK